MTETTRSKPHRKIEAVLDDLRIGYISECESYPPYQLDLYLPEWHLCVEVDGPTHTLFNKRDAKRDDVLASTYGIPTLRIRTDGESMSRAYQTILRFIETHAESAEARRSIEREHNS